MAAPLLCRPEHSGLVFEQLAADQVDEALDVLEDAAAWLASQGIVQWPASFRRPTPADVHQDYSATLHTAAMAGELWVLRDQTTHRAVGTIAITDQIDADFAAHWPGGPGDASYLSRLAVRREAAGNQLGGLLLDGGARVASSAGTRWVRLHCAKRNPRLQEYYLSQGFRHITTVDLPHRKSGALFERPAYQLRLDPNDPGEGYVVVLHDVH